MGIKAKKGLNALVGSLDILLVCVYSISFILLVASMTDCNCFLPIHAFTISLHI